MGSLLENVEIGYKSSKLERQLLECNQSEKNKIYFICTGGTIDKDYARKARTYNFEIAEPAVGRILEIVNPSFNYEIKSILKKDSIDITNEDREFIFKEVEKTDYSNVIITHGTDTMINTAEKLSHIKNKTIILVGSSLPEKFAHQMHIST